MRVSAVNPTSIQAWIADSALKIVYMAIREASRKWTMPVKHWKEALNHFAILFENRVPQTTN